MRPTLVLIAACSLVAAGCREIEFTPAGSYSDVVVVVDGDRNGPWAALLLPILDREYDYYVASEPLFKVTLVPSARVTEPQGAKSIVLCGVMDATTRVGARIISLLGDVGASQVRRGEGSIFAKQNVPLAGQLTVIVTAASEDALRKVLADGGDEIPRVIDESARARLRSSMLEHRRAELSEHLHSRWGFHLDIPSLYSLYSESDSPPGVELHHDGPPRVLGVFWREWDHAPTLQRVDELFEFRATYVDKRYDGDRMDRARTVYSYARLGQYTGVRLAGYWYNDRYEAAGGYYETYFIWDPGQEMLWAVDLLVYAPGQEKTTLIRELRAVADTFRYD